MDHINTRQEKINKVIDQRQEGVIVLEDIHDPHNAAAVWRTADCFGFQRVYMICDQEERINPKRTGKASSSSANKWLDFKIFSTTEECLTELKKEGFRVYATILDRKAKSLFETKFEERKIAIMLGNEHKGLSETAVKMADELIYIPMEGMVQSLNLSVTAAILMFEISRQRKGGDFGLDKKEIGEIKKRWQFF